MKLLISTIVILITANIVYSAYTCHLRELDVCAATLLVFTQNPSGIAESENELDKQCIYLREADSCLRNYTTKCATPLQRQLITFVTEGSSRLLDEYCTPRTQLRQSYLKHAPCLNRVQRVKSDCVRDFQAALDALNDVDWDKRIPSTCCAYKRFAICGSNIVQRQCGKDSVEFVNLLFRMALSQLPDFICRGYRPKRPECVRFLPPIGTTPKGSRSNSVLSRLFSAYTGF